VRVILNTEHVRDACHNTAYNYVFDNNTVAVIYVL